MIKQWFQSKTIWYGILSTLIGITAFVAANPKIAAVALINGILVIVLRTVTNTAIGTPAALAPVIDTTSPVMV